MKEIAQAFEAQAAAIVAERGPAPLRAKGGRLRPVKVVDPAVPGSGAGAVRKIADHAAVVRGALKREGIEAAVEGKRPRVVGCLGCGVPIMVQPNGGKILDRCRRCRGAVCGECGQPSAQGKPVKICGACVAARAARRRTCECGSEKHFRAKRCRECARADVQKSAAPQKLPCVDCGLPATPRGSGRCRSCGCKWREANRSPEERARIAGMARAQLTPEQRRELARKGGLASMAALTPEQRRERARASQPEITPERRAELSRRARATWAAMTPDERSARAHKTWRSRRAKKGAP